MLSRLFLIPCKHTDGFASPKKANFIFWYSKIKAIEDALFIDGSVTKFSFIKSAKFFSPYQDYLHIEHSRFLFHTFPIGLQILLIPFLQD